MEKEEADGELKALEKEDAANLLFVFYLFCFVYGFVFLLAYIFFT